MGVPSGRVFTTRRPLVLALAVSRLAFFLPAFAGCTSNRLGEAGSVRDMELLRTRLRGGKGTLSRGFCTTGKRQISISSRNARLSQGHPLASWARAGTLVVRSAQVFS